jgi:hypothetical protein
MPIPPPIPNSALLSADIPAMPSSVFTFVPPTTLSGSIESSEDLLPLQPLNNGFSDGDYIDGLPDK